MNFKLRMKGKRLEYPALMASFVAISGVSARGCNGARIRSWVCLLLVLVLFSIYLC